MKHILPLLLLAATFASSSAFAAPAECPQVKEQLTEMLASAKQRIGSEAEMRVEFEVDAQGRAHLLSLQGKRQYKVPVRIAMDSLDCQAGAPQRYVLNIRFADPVPQAMAAAASATVAQAEPR